MAVGGEVAKFTLAPEFAYGEEGSPPKIPPKADVRHCHLGSMTLFLHI